MGINDPAAVLLAAQDPDDGTLYFYREYYKTDQVITQVGLAIREMIKDIPQGMLNMPLIDPSANKRNKVNGRTYKQQMQVEHDLIFKDANNRLEDGISKTRDMMYNGKIKFFRSLTNTITEGCEYRYPNESERKSNKNLGDIPVDKNNHLMDCLRYICQEVPYNYMDLKRMSYSGIKKFFENMGFTTNVNKSHSRGYGFEESIKQALSISMYNYSALKQKRSSGGFKI